MPDQLRLRIVLVAPPAGYAFCLQRGKGAKGERLAYIEAAKRDITFDFAVTVRQGKCKDAPDFAGPFVQGPPGARFFYICIGRCSTIAEPHWVGRAKVPLGSITWPLVRQAGHGECVLEARYAAARADGQAAFASVPLLGDGWTVLHEAAVSSSR